MVDFMLNDLNLNTFLRQIESKSFGIDEIMLPTLQATDALDAPGGFTHACLDKGIDVFHITRYSVYKKPEFGRFFHIFSTRNFFQK
jgi:hypothetical protein